MLVSVVKGLISLGITSHEFILTWLPFCTSCSSFSHSELFFITLPIVSTLYSKFFHLKLHCMPQMFIVELPVVIQLRVLNLLCPGLVDSIVANIASS